MKFVGGQFPTVLLHEVEQVVFLLLSSLLQLHLLIGLVDEVLKVVTAESLDQVELKFEGD